MKNIHTKTITIFALLLSLGIISSAEAFVFKAALQGLKACAYTTFGVLALDSYIYPDSNRTESSMESVIKSCDKHYKKFKNFINTQPEPSVIVNNIVTGTTKSLETLNNTEIAHDVHEATGKVAEWLNSQRTTQS